MPEITISSASTSPTAGRIKRRLRRGAGGSGRLRTAVAMPSRLTRQAESATTRSVRSTPSVYETTMLRLVTPNRISMSKAASAPEMAKTIPNEIATPSAAPMTAAARSYATPS